jgi:phage baseplate assembly protein W
VEPLPNLAVLQLTLLALWESITFLLHFDQKKIQINTVMAITRYRGFSTINQYKKFRLTDLELIKRDLLNTFSIRKGEKLMNPNFGSIIWNVLFEPLTADVKALVVADIQRVVSYDPRLRVDNVLVDQFEYGLQIQIELTFLPDNLSDVLAIQFDRDSNSLAAT